MKTKQTKTKVEAPSEGTAKLIKTARLCGTLSGCVDELSRAQKAILGAVARLRQAAEDLEEAPAKKAQAMADELEKQWKSVHERDLQVDEIIAGIKTSECKPVK